MKVKEVVYIGDYTASQQMTLYRFLFDVWPKDSTDPWIKKTLGMFDQVVLAKLDDSDELVIIYDKYKGWINGFEHFNAESDEVETNEA